MCVYTLVETFRHVLVSSVIKRVILSMVEGGEIFNTNENKVLHALKSDIIDVCNSTWHSHVVCWKNFRKRKYE